MTAADQLVWAPGFIMWFWFCALSLERIQCGEAEGLTSFLRKHWWTDLKVNWQLWIPAQVLNFWIVPVQFRVLFANFVALIWNTYLSWGSQRGKEAPLDAPSSELTQLNP